MNLHHYTSISTLALILKSKRLRFTRMDLVDDLKEADGAPKGMETFTFVSCWTEDPEESIPLWKMYTQDLAGVKITLPKSPFMEFRYRAGDIIALPDGRNITIHHDCSQYLPFEELITPNYTVFQFFEKNGEYEGYFCKKVEYRDDYNEIYKNLVKYDQNSNSADINGLFSFGLYKSTKWAFQRETRFTLYCDRFLPLEHRDIQGDPVKQYKATMQKYNPLANFNFDELYDIKHIDLPINEDFLNNITITLGPKCSYSDELIVEALKDKYVKNATIVKSSLTGHIR